jgi:hypothetical protein
MNSHSPVGLVSRQWDTVDWACVLWPAHSRWPSEQISFIMTMHLPILQLSCRLFGQSITSPRSAPPPPQPRFCSLRLLAFPKAKIIIETEEICECDSHTVNMLSQWSLTADWLAPRESDCSWMHSKVSSDWLLSYVKVTWPVLEIFKMAGYFLDSPCKTPLKKITYDSCHNKDIISIHLPQQRHITHPPAYNASVCYLELHGKQWQNHKYVYYTFPLLLKYVHCNEHGQ